MDPKRLCDSTEAVTREFIATEIECGMTFAGLAATEYTSGQWKRGRELLLKAQSAHDEASHWIVHATARGWDLKILSERLHDLAARLAGMDRTQESA